MAEISVNLGQPGPDVTIAVPEGEALILPRTGFVRRLVLNVQGPTDQQIARAALRYYQARTLARDRTLTKDIRREWKDAIAGRRQELFDMLDRRPDLAFVPDYQGGKTNE